ncbi:hypothetical protein [Streptosporangium sp. OZ121]|uniref:hypothetical protein n=1 Tax=Streptosporangium sp. OZ121 TaxID=3444183 RepID=UPI003F78B0FF
MSPSRGILVINEYTLYDWVQMDRLAAGRAGGDGGGRARSAVRVDSQVTEHDAAVTSAAAEVGDSV